MEVKTDEVEFEWDEGNRDKNRLKHGVTTEEAESVFADPNSIVIPDEKHSEVEERSAIVGKSKERRKLFVIFTWRKGKLRIISVRRMHKKEVERYDKIKKNSQI